MTLGFSLQINGKDMHFMEKILCGHFWDMEMTHEMVSAFINPAFDEKYLDTNKPKLHSIRDDKTNRWRAGMPIQMVVGNRTKQRLQFAPTVPCTKVQAFKIVTHYHDNTTGSTVFIDGKEIGSAFWQNCMLVATGITLKKFIQNDGFDDVNEFFEYFPEQYTGKLIHWTNREFPY